MSLDKKIKELALLETSVDTDRIVIDDVSEPDSTRTKQQTKQNFLKEIWTNFSLYFTKTESDSRYLQNISEQDLSTADNSISQFITLADIPVVTSDFISLTDTPVSYLNQAGKTVVVNGQEDGLVFFSLDNFLTDIAGQDLSTADNSISEFITISSVPTTLAELSDDSTHRLVTDTDISNWNGKQDELGFTPEDSANKDQVSGYAGLDMSGKINPLQLPSIAITNTFVVDSQEEMLLLIVDTGDVAVRTDVSKSFILQGTDGSVLTDWVELLSPTDSVASVFGRTGTVTAQNNDYTADQIEETETRVFITPEQETNLDNQSGTNTGDQDLSGLVPYTGASADVELGAFGIHANILQADSNIQLNDGAQFDFYSDQGITMTGSFSNPSAGVYQFSSQNIDNGYGAFYFDGLTSTRDYTFPDADGTIALFSDIPDVSVFAKLDGTNQPFTGDIEISKATPELKLTSTGDSNPTRLTKSSTLSTAIQYNKAENQSINYSLSFDGVNESVTVSNSALNINSDYTISAWVNVTSNPAPANSESIISWGEEATGKRRAMIIFDGGGGPFRLYSSTFASNVGGTSALTVGTWFHCAITVTAGTTKIYVNGVLETTGANTLNAFTYATNGTSIGKGNGAVDYANALVDDARIYSRVLSLAEIQNIYNKVEPSTAGLQLFFKFNEGSGVTTTDESANALTGTLNNTPTWSATVATNSFPSGADTEYKIWSSYDGPVTSYGDDIVETRINGKNVNFDILGINKVNINSNGDTTFLGDVNISKTLPELLMTSEDGKSFSASRDSTNDTARLKNTITLEPKSLTFASASAQYIQVNDSASFDTLTGDMTFVMWLKPTTNQSIYSNVLRKNFGSGGFGIEMNVSTHRSWYFFYANGGTVYVTSSLTAIPADTWTNIAFIKTGTTVKGYINGVENTSNTFGTSVVTTNDVGLDIARWTNTNERYYNGGMKDLRIYSRAIGTTELTDLVAGDDIATTNLVAQYTFNEGSGLAVFDSSPNGNVGIIKNGATFSTDVPAVLDVPTDVEVDIVNNTNTPVTTYGSSIIPSIFNGTALSFYIGGVIKGIMDYAGRLGIGTATPDAKLTVQATSGSSDNLVAIKNSAGTNLVTVNVSGNMGIGQSTPTAVLHLKAGTATANTAPLKLTSGTLNTTPEVGAIEFLTDRLTYTGTTGTTRKDIADFSYRAITALRTLDGSDEMINCTANSFTVTLPTAVGFTKQYTIKNSGTGTITLATTSSQTIDGQISGAITLSQWEGVTLRSTGANWLIV